MFNTLGFRLNQIEEPDIRAKAIEYCKSRNIIDMPCYDLAQLSNLFIWRTTPQGRDFWKDIYLKYKNKNEGV